MATNSEKIFPSPSSSRYLQRAAVSLLHHHLHVVEDEVERHAPHGLHRLLHEPERIGLNAKKVREVEKTRRRLNRRVLTFSCIL